MLRKSTGLPPATMRGIPRIEYLRVQNFRALHNLELKNLRPLTVFLGPNGSGKSTIFDVFAFLAECFGPGLSAAWNKRQRLRELRTRDSTGPIVIEIKYKEPALPLVTYHVEIAEDGPQPIVAREWLQWRRGQRGKPFKFLDFERGRGKVISGEEPDDEADRIEENLASPSALAVNALGQLARHHRVAALRRFITSWYLSYLSADSTRSTPESGPQERLSQTGDNLPNVIQYLAEQHPDRLERITDALKARVPRLEKVEAELLRDGRLLLQIKDAPFAQPILARFASDGTLKMLAYLTMLYDPTPPQVIAIEEPENYLHPRLLPLLAEECRAASARTQLMLTTHSPHFVDALKPEEVWVLERDARGHTVAKRAADMQGVRDMIEAGAQLGQLWMEGFFSIGDPLTRQRPEGDGSRAPTTHAS